MYDKQRAEERLTDGHIIVTRHGRDGRTIYNIVRSDHTVQDLIEWGIASVEVIIQTLPIMTEKEISDAGLSRYYRDGKFMPGAKTFLLESEAHPVDTSHVRRGTRYVYDTVRKTTKVQCLSKGTEEQMRGYRALLEVTVASGRIEINHDPYAVHLTPVMAGIVLRNLDKKDDIIRYITERRVIVRDIDYGHLEQYLSDIPRAVSQGFL